MTNDKIFHKFTHLYIRILNCFKLQRNMPYAEKYAENDDSKECIK